jgi:hypothetical protein
VIFTDIGTQPTRYALTSPEYLFAFTRTLDSLREPPSIVLRNDGHAKRCLVYDADRALLAEGRATFTSCMVLAVISALATPIAYLLPEQNADTRLTGQVLITGTGVFTTGAIVGGILTRRGRARLALSDQRRGRRLARRRRRRAVRLAAAEVE